MFTVNGSVKTIGSDNYLPIDTLYNYKRHACRFSIHIDENKDYTTEIDPTTNEKIINYYIKDKSPYNNLLHENNIILKDISKEELVKSHYFGKMIMSFDGYSSYISSNCDNKILINKSLFTISCWFSTQYYSLQNSKTRHIFILGDTIDNIGIAFEDSSGNAASKPSVIITDNNVKTIIENKTRDCSDTNWHHLLITRDTTNTIRYFVDGYFIDSTISTVNVGWNSKTAGLFIGCYLDQNCGFFNGIIDEFYVLNGLSQKFDDTDFDTAMPIVPYLVPIESEKDYSGMVFHAKLGEKVSKYDLVYYNSTNRNFQLADSLDIKKLPVRGIALEDGNNGDTIQVLAYGTISTNINDFSGEENEYISLLPIWKPSTSLLNQDLYSVYATSGNSEYCFDANKADQKFFFDQSYWTPGTSGTLPWLRIKLYSQQTISSYKIVSTDTSVGWKLKASNDKETWVLLDDQKNIDLTKTDTFFISNQIKDNYQYYEFFDFIGLTNITNLFLYDDNEKSLIPRHLFVKDLSDEDSIYVKTVSITGDTPGFESYHLFDGNVNTYWQPGGASIVGDILIDFGMWWEPGIFEFAKVDKIAITCNANSSSNKMIYVPFEFMFLGSDHNSSDESKWDVLYHYNITDEADSVWTDYNHRVEFDLDNNDKYYRYYKFTIKKTDIIKPFSCTTYDVPIDFRLSGFELLDNLSNKININGTSERTKLYDERKYSIIDNATTSDTPSYLITNDISTKTDGWSIASTFDPTNPISVIINFGDKEWIKQYIIYPLPNSTKTGSENSTPKSWKFYGSNDNTNWDLLDSYLDNQSDLSTYTDVFKRTLSNSVNYQYYKIEILDTFDNSLGVHLYHVEFKNALNKVVFLPTFSSTEEIIQHSVFDSKIASFSINAIEEDNTSYNSARNLTNDIFFFNICENTDYQWKTISNLTPYFIFNLPSISHSEYNRKINGYTIISQLDANDHNHFRSPISWVIRGYDGITKNWIEIDRQNDIHFRTRENYINEVDCGGVKLNFKLKQTYDTLEKIQFEVLSSEGSTAIIAPPYIGLKNFYPTYEGQILEFPRFSNSHIAVTNEERPLNYYYSNKKDFNIEVSCSSINSIDNITSLFDEDTTTNFSFGSDSTLATISDTQLDSYSHSIPAIEIDLQSSKRIVAYGIYYSIIALSGLRYPATRWTLKGSNDGVNWDILDRIGLVTTDMVLKSYPMIFEINTSKSYKFYKFDDLNGGFIHGIELYEYNTIKKCELLTLSINNPGKLSTKELINNYHRRKINKYYIQNLGHTEFDFTTAEEEYSVKYFDFNTDIKLIDPNVGNLVITSDPSDPYNNGYGHTINNGPLVTLLCNSLEIQENAILTTNVPCRGLQIIVLNDCLINGTISMTSKGPAYSPKWVNDFPIYDHYGNLLDAIPRYGANGGIFTPLVAGVDQQSNWKQGAATATVYQALRCGSDGLNGSTIVDNKGNAKRATGGGGSGSAVCYVNSLLGKAGDGGRGSCFSGGAGGSGIYLSNIGNTDPNPYKRYTAIPAINDATLSGSSFCSNANRIYGCDTSVGYTSSTNNPDVLFANGAGLRVGSTIYGYNNGYDELYPINEPTFDSSGAGGLIILIVYGNLYTGLTGRIESNGSQPQNSLLPACGGGSGGGSINIFVGGTHINNGVYEALGGKGGVGSSPFDVIYTDAKGSYIPGGNGGNGSITITKL